ncbi:MAG: hypothetical protein GY754_28310 [bacterium]|nr:hypothetical protein [bacterium]
MKISKYSYCVIIYFIMCGTIYGSEICEIFQNWEKNTPPTAEQRIYLDYKINQVIQGSAPWDDQSCPEYRQNFQNYVRIRLESELMLLAAHHHLYKNQKIKKVLIDLQFLKKLNNIVSPQHTERIISDSFFHLKQKFPKTYRTNYRTFVVLPDADKVQTVDMPNEALEFIKQSFKKYPPGGEWLKKNNILDYTKLAKLVKASQGYHYRSSKLLASTSDYGDLEDSMWNRLVKMRERYRKIDIKNLPIEELINFTGITGETFKALRKKDDKELLSWLEEKHGVNMSSTQALKDKYRLAASLKGPLRFGMHWKTDERNELIEDSSLILEWLGNQPGNLIKILPKNKKIQFLKKPPGLLKLYENDKFLPGFLSEIISNSQTIEILRRAKQSLVISIDLKNAGGLGFEPFKIWLEYFQKEDFNKKDLPEKIAHDYFQKANAKEKLVAKQFYSGLKKVTGKFAKLLVKCNKSANKPDFSIYSTGDDIWMIMPLPQQNSCLGSYKSSIATMKNKILKKQTFPDFRVTATVLKNGGSLKDSLKNLTEIKDFNENRLKKLKELEVESTPKYKTFFCTQPDVEKCILIDMKH